ncbi:MAG TPA: hypothetical protein DCO79_04470 [Spirochaeta sp.]|nr:hypothetical protein [Spirochaeta sp.]
MLVSHLKDIGKYTLSERVLLKKVLEEQALQMSGMVDEEITISGRVIKTESGEIIASGTIFFVAVKGVLRWYKLHWSMI